MKKNILKYTISACVLSFLTILAPGHSEALDLVYEVSIQYSFDPPTGVSGYRLYKDGIPVNGCVESPAGSQMTCPVDTPGTFDFTLAAVYVNGRESPQSAPFPFSVTCEGAALVALQVLSGQNPQDIETMGSLAGTPVIEMADIIHSLRQSVQ